MLVARTGLSPVMVGRATELTHLERALTSDAGAHPTVALLAGEAGIGKTRLVQELVARAPAGIPVLAGQADPDSYGRPLALFLDALGLAAVPAVPAGTAAPSPGTGTSASASASPLADMVGDEGRSSEERVRAAVDLVRAMTGGGRGLVVFEDLHWADSESIKVFERLAEPTSGPLLLVGTYRPDALSRRHPASDLLPRLDRRHSVVHIQLGRLTPGEVGSLLAAIGGQAPSYRAVDTLWSRTGGNPFFLEELVASAGDGLCTEDILATPLPWTVAEVVRANFDDLDPEVRRIVATAAVLGRRARFDDLAAVTDTAEDDLIDRLRAALDSGLLVETEADVFGFPHELAREAVEASLLGRERRRIHEAAYEALSACADDDAAHGRATSAGGHAALARHAQGAGRYEDMVDHARLGAHEAIAVGSSYQAVQLAELGLSEADDDLDLLATAARSAWLAGLTDDAVEHADRWLAVAARSGDADEEAEALGTRMRVAYEVGDMDGMRRYVDRLADSIEQLSSDERRARAMAAVAQYFMLRDKVAPTVKWADEALALAEEHGLDDVRLAATVEKGSVLLHEPERLDEGRKLLEAAADEAEALGEHVLAARALNNLLWCARQWRDADDIPVLIERMRRQGEAAGFVDNVNGAYVAALAEHAAVQGDLGEALRLLDEHRDNDPIGAGWLGGWLHMLRAGLALEAGDIATAAELCELAKPPTQKNAAAVIGLDVHVAFRRGEPDEARRLLAELLTVVDADGYANPGQVHDIVAAGLQAGADPAELRPLVDRAGFHWQHRLESDHPWHQLLEAQLADAEGRAADALRLYQTAGARLGFSTDIHAGHHGTTHVGAARCLIVLDRLDEARAEAESAAAYLAQWRGWRVAELDAVQRRLGLGSEPSGPESLTPREREVAALLADGLTNAELAERLFISPRTAAVHVSNILTKLGMSSRTEVATWYVRQQGDVGHGR
jgi:DNA-binding CsgD family transcriptional regulator